MATGQEIMDMLKEVNSLLDRALKKYFSEGSITVPQLNIVNILSKVEKVKQSDLSHALMTTPAAVSGIMDRLEAQGVVERVRSAEDKRVVYARLTNSFKESHRDLDNNIGGFLSLIIQKQELEEIEKIVQGLEAFKRVLQSSDEVILNHIGNREGDQEEEGSC
jgi:DNA-binding MarR family transcriptional regulator